MYTTCTLDLVVESLIYIQCLKVGQFIETKFVEPYGVKEELVGDGN